MKKFISLALALMMLMALCACGGSEESKAPESTAPEQSSSAPESAAPEAPDLGTLEAGKIIMSTNAQFPPYEMVAAGEGAYADFEGIDLRLPLLWPTSWALSW